MNDEKTENSDAHQAFRHGGLVHGGEMLFKGQYNAVGDDGSEDQVLKWSGRVKENTRITIKPRNINSKIFRRGRPK